VCGTATGIAVITLRMSLGWQCESALLPSKSKPINVDGKSMVGLKALLYNEERQRHVGSEVASSFTRRTRPTDKIRSFPTQAAGKGAHTELTADEKAMRALEAKAKLYDHIVKGKEKLTSDLVDFEEKQLEEKTLELVDRADPVPPPPKPPSIPRPATVNIHNTQDSDSLHDQRSPRVVSTAQHYNWSNTYNTTECSSSASAVQRTVPICSGQDDHDIDHNERYLRDIQRERELKRTVEQRLRQEELLPIYANSDHPLGGSVSEAARVKTQWEKTLNSSAREFLDEVHSATARLREHSSAGENGSTSTEAGDRMGQKRSLKEERLELIRQKRSKAASGNNG
jgi:hypothetical protein